MIEGLTRIEQALLAMRHCGAIASNSGAYQSAVISGFATVRLRVREGRALNVYRLTDQGARHADLIRRQLYGVPRS